MTSAPPPLDNIVHDTFKKREPQGTRPVHPIETMREHVRSDIAGLLKDVFSFHERFVGCSLASIWYAGALLHRTREGAYVVYGVDNTIYFSSENKNQFHERLDEWFFPLIDEARLDGIAPCYLKGFKIRPQASKP